VQGNYVGLGPIYGINVDSGREDEYGESSGE
jgi:hypothetical protein